MMLMHGARHQYTDKACISIKLNAREGVGVKRAQDCSFKGTKFVGGVSSRYNSCLRMTI